jgi:hypothetical protein
MDLSTIFRDFVTTVEKRLADGRRFNDAITEDALCFYIAATFMRAGCAPDSIEMEIAHPTFKKEKGMQKSCDIRVFDEQASTWLEVKFDREPPSGASMNMTNRLGKLVNDLMRTPSIPGGNRLFLYVTTTTMLNYLSGNGGQYLGKASFMIDKRYVESLPTAAASQVEDYVLAELNTRTVLVEPLFQRKLDRLSRFLIR